MKAVKSIVLAALLLSARQAVALVDVSAFGGYTTLAMTEANNNLHTLYTSLGGAAAGLTENQMTSGYYAGIDAGFATMPFLKIGPRVELVGAGQGKIAIGTSSFSMDSTLMLYEAGLSSDIALPLTGLGVQVGIWGGYGMASGNINQVNNGVSAANPGVSGSGFVAEAAAQLRYSIMPTISLGLDLGYRMAQIAQMTYDKTTSMGNSGTAVQKTSSTDALPFDYSGLNVGGALSFNF